MRSANEEDPEDVAPAPEPGVEGTPLAAHAAERFLEVPRGRGAARARFGALVLAVFLLHAALIAAFLWRDTHDRTQLAQAVETPVEIVQEPPPEPPKPPSPPPTPTPPPPPKPKEDLSPAMSAPRAPNEQKVETQRTQEKTATPNVQPKPQEGQPQPKPQMAQPQEAAPAESKEDTAKEEDRSKPDAEALDKARPKVAKQSKTKEAKTAPRHKQTTNDLLASLASPAFSPEISFAKPTPKTKVYGGTEDVRWMAEVEGMLEAKVSQLPRTAHWQDGGRVVVFFHVDAGGSIISREIYQKSGYPDIDALAMRALAAAAPFPPPPPGVAHGLVWVTKFDGQLPTVHIGKN